MRVLITNSNSLQTGYLAGKFPDAIGHLYSPGGQRGPYEFMPYALDNGAFGAWTNKRPFDDQAWVGLLEWARNSGQPPLWALVPDVVADKDATLASWKRFAPVAAEYGWPLAFAVQDGMSTADVPSDADVIFVGGTTEWKWANAHRFGDRFNRVHIGRVNSLKFLRLAKNARAESCDGTGWLRGDQLQFRQLVHFLAEENKGGGFFFSFVFLPDLSKHKTDCVPWHVARIQVPRLPVTRWGGRAAPPLPFGGVNERATSRNTDA
jgi:hypothetical protein